MSLAPYNLVGFFGVGLLIAVYFANQQRWLRSDDWRFPAVNLAGSVLIFVSLLFEWNFPSAVIEVVWMLISLWGLVRSWRVDRPR